MKHLFVALLVVEGDYRDAIVDLVGERVHAIVHYNHVFHLAICDNAEIFDIVAFGGLNAVLSV